jgi:polyhydroxybutyrate depolymerase
MRFVVRLGALIALSLGLLVAGPVGVAAKPGKATGRCDAPYAAGQHTLTLRSGGLDRTYVLYIPSGYDGRHRLPLVLNLHGSGGSGEIQMQVSELAQTAEANDFILVNAQGYSPNPPGYRWNVPGVTSPAPGEVLLDDIQFLSDLIDELKSTLCVDAKRVYGTGYSGGGRMISQFACDRPDELAAIAPVAGLRAGVPVAGAEGFVPDPATCDPERSVPVRTFAGTADPVNPFAGGGAPYWRYGAMAALERWAEINGCRRGPQTDQVTEDTTLVRYWACPRNATVEMYVVAGGGHVWPGTSFVHPQLGSATQTISASDLMWEFFRRHRLPGSPIY